MDLWESGLPPTVTRTRYRDRVRRTYEWESVLCRDQQRQGPAARCAGSPNSRNWESTACWRAVRDFTPPRSPAALRGTASPDLFTTERQTPRSAAGFRKQLAVIGVAAELPFPIHPRMLRNACSFALVHGRHDTRAIQEWPGHQTSSTPHAHQPLHPSGCRLCLHTISGRSSVLRLAAKATRPVQNVGPEEAVDPPGCDWARGAPGCSTDLSRARSATQTPGCRCSFIGA